MNFKDFDFRVWDKETKCYIDNLAFLPKFKTSIGSCILAQDNGEWYSWDDTERIEIDLYTGYRDIRGNKVYDRDIIRIYRQSNYKPYVDCEVRVLLKEGRIHLKAFNKRDNGFLGTSPFKVFVDTAEIIGNIHDKVLNGN
ncbi:MAG: YopX family protein [Helicobacter sp.]|nr:YopX family protein [Helicobacter sp.]